MTTQNPQVLVEVDVERRTASAKRNGVNMTPVFFTPKELDLLIIIAEAEGKFMSREKLLNALWDVASSDVIDTRTVDQHIARLRKKLGSASKVIKTVTNYGYASGGGIVLLAETDKVGKVRKVDALFEKGRPWLDITVRVPHTERAPKVGSAAKVVEALAA